MFEISEKIKELENKVAIYEAIMEMLDVGIHVVDNERNTVIYNEAMARMEGEDPGKVVGRPFMEENIYFKNKESTLLQVLDSGETISDATQSYFNSRGLPVVTVNRTQPLLLEGEMIGAIEVATDVTQIQLLSEKIMDLHEASSRKSQPRRERSCSTVRYSFDDILGRSPAIAQARTQARKIAKTSSNVLICGETGTGKELFAQSIHAASSRRGKPFIDINCAALPPQLLEGLLFGSVKGGFTDAQDRPGLFEQAHGGTLLLDEINSMDMALQGKLLRALQEKKIRRLGAVNSTDIDVRVISTINKSPEQAMEDRELREDLFYRLSVTNLQITPLRARQEDIPVYVDHFLLKYAHKLGLRITSCSPKVMAMFQHHPWPGNIRQLEHAIEGALNLVNPNDETILVEHLPALFRADGYEAPAGKRPKIVRAVAPDYGTGLDGGKEDEYSGGPGELKKLKTEKQQIELGIIKKALDDNNFNISRAARQMGITRQLLQHKIKKYGLKAPQDQANGE